MPRQLNGQFDHRVEIRDPKTGKTLKHQPFTMEISASGQTFWDAQGCYDCQGNDIPDPKKKTEAVTPVVSPARVTAKVEKKTEAVVSA
jgi:hypothetical protein